MTAVSRGLHAGGRSLRGGGGALRRRGGGVLTAIRAVMVKESRGRMRGRRAFVVLTLYLLLLGIFSFAVYHLVRQNALSGATTFGQPIPDRGFPGGPVSSPAVGGLSASIGHALFSSLLSLETLLVLVLAPAFTTGAISLEREKQTLELLVTTPLSTLGMVIGKLLSALVYVFLLILASIPFVAIVFPFGGVGPEDILRAYAVLFALAFGMGAIGLFVSAMVRRTQTAMVLTIVLMLGLTLGATGAHHFIRIATREPAKLSANGQQLTPAKPGGAPEALLWLNPFVSAADLICTTAPSGADETCAYLANVTRKPYFGGGIPVVDPGVCPPEQCGGMPGFPGIDPAMPMPVPMPVPAEQGDGGVVVDGGPAASPALDGVHGTDDVVVHDGAMRRAPGPIGGGLPAVGFGVAEPGAVEPPVGVSAFGYPRDTFWPHSTVAFLVVGVLLTLLSAQLVAPTRGFRPRRLSVRRWSGTSGVRGDGPAGRSMRGATAEGAEPEPRGDVSPETSDKPATESPA
jgi:ABC-type transport system involved in multi-copper enzyme maturation permease subunit